MNALLKKWVLLGAVVWIGLFSGCMDSAKNKAIAEPEIAKFHEKLKARDFEALYASASEAFKQALPREKAVALFAAIDRKLGALQTTELSSWKASKHDKVIYVGFIQKTQFVGGTATETFTYTVIEGKPELYSYNIDSIDMLIK